MKRTVHLGDRVVIEHPLASGDTTKETFIVAAQNETHRQPVPWYGPDHPVSKAVMGRNEGDEVVYVAGPDMDTEVHAKIIEVTIPEPAES